jgi:hypothetical protein
VDPSDCTDPGTIYPEDPSLSYNYNSGVPTPTTLGSPFGYMLGGIRILNPQKGICTLGFPVMYQGRKSFVTVSHCTPAVEGFDGSRFLQPNESRNPEVAREVADPYIRVWGKRLADAAIAEMVNGFDAYVGSVARPANRMNRMNISSGDTTLAPGQYPRIVIIGEGSPVKDAVFDKVGATTGWTSGAARRVCVPYLNYECATWVAAGTWDGDSGAPVLRYYPNSNQALLVGMVITKEAGGFWMNPISQIRKHFNATGSRASILRTY